ncbi:MAG: hypothetical protein EXR73_14870, partial [Myxococcales bacterium]|nr:hypothetical protein [Myxococcales bacterium]
MRPPTRALSASAESIRHTAIGSAASAPPPAASASRTLPVGRNSSWSARPSPSTSSGAASARPASPSSVAASSIRVSIVRRTVARALGAAGGSGGCAIDAAVLLDDFDYALPEELIAQQPAPRRDGSRLLHVGAGDALAHHQFDALPTLLVPGTLLVVNDAKVLPARVRAKKPSGGAVEVLFLGPAPADGEGVWSCLVRGKSLRPGTTLEVVASTVGSTGSTSS